ncbi:serine hydrolase [Spirulina major CS-329]|uniref:serine hydrolase n=1 Tax=Spirulina TaxID=1154 RepID=UPI002330BA03|nr:MULTISPECIES: serine hydrolase [Spirulina]MDB9494718.1 serine hydrolase [Spirulina subsalsa CS-330]MDB9502748.1 serine hydrolase [Spirulina major CS-329]
MSDPYNAQDPKIPKPYKSSSSDMQNDDVIQHPKAHQKGSTQFQNPGTYLQNSPQTSKQNQSPSRPSKPLPEINEHSYKEIFEDSYCFVPLMEKLVNFFKNKHRFLIITIPTVMGGVAWAGIQVLSPSIEQVEESPVTVSEHASSPNPPNLIPPTPPTMEITQPSPLPSVESSTPNGMVLTPENTANINTSDFLIRHQQDPNLQRIINEVLNLVAQKNLSTQHLSVTLLDLNTEKYAGYQSSQLHFPASVVKLFWMAVIFSKIEQEGVDQVSRSYQEQFSIDLGKDLDKLIKESDNEAGSRIVDFLTGASSGESLPRKDLEEWIKKRYFLNDFFIEQGYGPINISQKTFPIPYLKYLDGPEGRDTQIRQNDTNPSVPIRNQITAEQATRLLYEIMKGNVGGANNSGMIYRLHRDLTTDWRKIDPNLGHFNPVQAFFGEGLAAINPNIQIYSKAGWTSQTRQEVAYINDGRKQYILTVFAEDKSFSEDEQIFPAIARYVHEQMPQ